MNKSKKKYFLYILLLFILIILIPVIIFLLIKNQYAFSFSLIPVAIITIILFKISIINKLNKRNIIWGFISILYPLVVIIFIGLFAFLFDKDLKLNIYYLRTVDFFITLLMIFIVLFFTEEVIFRCVFWELFSKLEVTLLKKNIYISLLFVLWHIPIIILFPDFQLEFFVIPIYLLNIFLFSINIGIIRYLSNSIFFVSFCHALWNTLVYTFFGYGKTFGSWGIKKYFLFDPERGLIGILLQVLIVIFFLLVINIKQNKKLYL